LGRTLPQAREVLRSSFAVADEKHFDSRGKLAQCTPKAVTAQKRLIRAWEDLPLRDAIQAGIDAFEEAARSGEPAKAMAAFLARRRSK